MQFIGAFTALVTPFKNSALDEEGYRQLIEWQIEQGIDGLVPCGTTGESATLTHEEHERAISICIDQAKKRVPIIAGAGSNNTREAVRLVRYAKDAGADAALLITPYYNKPTQEGLFQHYKAIAAEVSIPTIVYNVPGRTGINVSPALIARLYKEIPEVVGIKEATGDLTQISSMLELCGDGFTLLSGDDFTVLPTLAIGGAGTISVVSNLVPGKMSQMCKAQREGNYALAKKLHYELSPLCRACFLETNPIPVKTALSLMGKFSADLRLPLVPLAATNAETLKRALQEHKLIN